MALFGRRSGNAAPTPPTGPGGAGGESAFNPENAAKFFQHARTIHDTGEYEYAMTLWLQGLQRDPTNMAALEGFFNSAAGFLGTKPKGLSKDTLRTFDGKSDLERYLRLLLEWGSKPLDADAALKASAAAGRMGLREPALWLGERALVVSRQDKKQSKSRYVQLMELFKQFESYDKAVIAGEIAKNMDPSDAKLAAGLKNMSAQATMSKGGYDQTGEAGGFRANIRDAEKQKRLEEEGRLVRTESTVDRLVEAAKADYEARPSDRPAIRKYADRLRERGRPEDEKAAYELLMKAWEQTQEFKFRQDAGDIRLKQARRRLEQLRAAAARPEAEAQAKEAFEQFRRRLEDAEIEEFKLRITAYPTDLSLKFEAGRRLFEAGRYEESIEFFQEAKAEVKNRSRVMNYLGQAFQAIGWHDEGIETFRAALEGAAELDAEMTMELRYGLLKSLQARAAEQNELASAEEAYKLASTIAMQQINYKDIRARREELKGLIAKLKAGGAPAA